MHTRRWVNNTIHSLMCMCVPRCVCVFHFWYIRALLTHHFLARMYSAHNETFEEFNDRFVKFFEGLKFKTENDNQYKQYLEVLKPLREELGVQLKEEIYSS